MRVLVVEDEQKIADFLKASLESEYFVVDVARDGKEGSYLARTNAYDIIILDNILPHKTGLEICKEIRQTGNDTPICMLSVKSETFTKVELLNAGADDYLIKPFSFDELLARVHALLRRPQPIEDEILTVDDLTLDVKRHQVIRGKKEVRLTRKEFMLLEYMIKNRGIVLSRSMLMEHVWESEMDPFSNTIEAHILSLRRKIGSKGKKTLIHTVSGRGYKLDTKR